MKNLFQQSGAELAGIPVGVDGIDLDALQKNDALQKIRPRLLVVTPNFQNPTGATMPLEARRARLTREIRPSAALQLSKAWRDNAQRRFGDACHSGWEGLIAKRANAPYVPGRSKDWLKLKCVWEQEFIIGGYTDPTGSRTDFGALLVGYHEDGRLRYAGKVGTGYTAARLRDLGARLRSLETSEPSFMDARPIPRGTHWTRPELVAQIGFAEWTNDGRLRQPRFLGLRDDKRPAEVVRERPR